MDDFDWRRGYRLATFATWRIRKAILNAIEAEATIHLPHNIHWRIRKIREVADSFFVENGRQPTVAEVASLVGVSPAEILVARHATRLINEMVSADEEETNGKDLQGGPRPDEEGIRFLRLRDLAELLDRLDPREKMAVELLYGLNGHQALSQIGTAKQMGTHPLVIRRIQRSALTKLKEWLSSVASR